MSGEAAGEVGSHLRTEEVGVGACNDDAKLFTYSIHEEFPSFNVLNFVQKDGVKGTVEFVKAFKDCVEILCRQGQEAFIVKIDGGAVFVAGDEVRKNRFSNSTQSRHKQNMWGLHEFLAIRYTQTWNEIIRVPSGLEGLGLVNDDVFDGVFICIHSAYSL